MPKWCMEDQKMPPGAVDYKCKDCSLEFLHYIREQCTSCYRYIEWQKELDTWIDDVEEEYEDVEEEYEEAE